MLWETNAITVKENLPFTKTLLKILTKNKNNSPLPDKTFKGKSGGRDKIKRICECLGSSGGRLLTAGID